VQGLAFILSSSSLLRSSFTSSTDFVAASDKFFGSAEDIRVAFRKLRPLPSHQGLHIVRSFSSTEFNSMSP
jgi:hypothetical protein